MKCHFTVQRHGPRSPTSPSGFTLVEIMVVIGILGMVLALGMPPFFRSMKKDPLLQAVSDIEGACRRAREQAILGGVPTEIVIRAGGQLTVAAVPVPKGELTAAGEEPEATLPKSDGFSAHLNEDVAITLLYVNLKDQMHMDESRVRFYSNGTSDEFTIVMQTGAGIRKISLECVTALASMEVIR
jgi:prepilin-type N-terminal cleavage/methylation domain-containing protein